MIFKVLKNSTLLVIFFVFSLINLFTLKAQNDYTDSLTSLLSKELDDTSRINVLLDLEDYYYSNESNFDGTDYYLKSLEIMENSGFKKLYTNFYKDNINYCYIGLARIYAYQSKHIDALKYYNKSQQYLESNGTNEQLAVLYSDFGIFYYQLTDYKAALAYGRRLINLEQNTSYTMNCALSDRIGVFYLANDQLDSASYYFEKAIQLNKAYRNNRCNIVVYSNLITLNIRKKEFVAAKKHLYAFKVAVNQSGSFVDSLRINDYFAYYYEATDQPEKALPYTLKNVALTKGEKNKNLYMDALQELAGVHVSMNNYKKAIETYDEILPLKDVYFNDQNSQEIGKLKAAYEFEKQSLADSINYNNQLNISALKLKNSRRLNGLYISLTFLGMISLFFLTSYFRLRDREQKTEIKLKDSKAKLTQQQLEKEKLQLKQEQLEKDNLALELKYKEKDIESLLDRTNFKEKLRVQILEELDDVFKFEAVEIKSELKKLYRKIDMKLEVQEQLNVDIDQRIENANTSFENKLVQLYPELTKRERELCISIKLGMSTKEISINKDISLNSIKSGLYRIRKKVNVEKTEDLYRIFKSF